MTSELLPAMIGLAGAVVGGGVSSLTALLIARHDREKFRRERSWSLRIQAYTRIIGALDRARAITAHIDHCYDEDPHAWDASDANRAAHEQMIAHFHEARTEFHANRLLLSQWFVAAYEKMNSALSSTDNPNLLPPESAAIAARVMTDSVAAMEALAREELGVSA